MRVIYIIAVGLALSGGAFAQSQNIAKTGAGNPFDTLEALEAEIKKYSDGRLGQVVKGAAGLVGMAAALSVANDSVNFRIRPDGSLNQRPIRGRESIDTTTVTSSSSSTN